MPELLPRESRSLEEVISFVLTLYNQRQVTLGRNSITNSEFAGLKSMMEMAVSNWIHNELNPIQEHFPDDNENDDEEIVTRIMMYLVDRFGKKSTDEKSVGINIASHNINMMLGKNAEIKIEENSITVIVK